MNPDSSSVTKETALKIAKRLVHYNVTNDLDIISSVVDVCKEDVVSYLKKPPKIKKALQSNITGPG
ncbi:hypothetical protein B4U37_13850 [Sutcliffiella horikoshii]|uniref:Uncharacterized protein n=1 Tax=Sutcliffiella horikoshii TaxID=79883 RepID=A0A1Y0CQ10_9BACI|nr:hypothetical protein [Sutcliffiella horikoshii]ART77066.1 hypothetical protein B4U37_13850 [Sutcliffiella horikoshii]TYS57610.1 hypothetical protein FZC74_16395 [Sutcliffiella horikoshii]